MDQRGIEAWRGRHALAGRALGVFAIAERMAEITRVDHQAHARDRVQRVSETAQRVYRQVGLRPAGYLVFEDDFVLSRQQGGSHGCEG